MQHRMREFQLTEEQIDQLLREAGIGHLGTVNEDGTPYVLATHFAYDGACVFLHGLPKGQKIDNIRRFPRVCFETERYASLVHGKDKACDTEAVYQSVVLNGRAEIVEDPARKRYALDQIIEKYTPEFSGRPIPDAMFRGTCVIEIRIETRTGKYHQE